MDGKTVVLNLGGKDRRLSYDLNAVAEIGDRLDIKIRLGQLGSDLMNTAIPLRALRTLLWAGLVHEDETLTEEEVGGWVTQDNLEEVMEGFFSLFGEIGPAMETPTEDLTEGLTIPEPIAPTDPEGEPAES